MRNNLPTLTPELRAEMQEKARIVREEKKEKAKGYKQEYMSKNHWAELCSKYKMKMPPYYAHCSETKYLRRAIRKIDKRHIHDYPEAMGCKSLKELVGCNPSYTAYAVLGLYLEWVEDGAVVCP